MSVAVPDEWSYPDYVNAGRQIVSRSAWALGDLACGVETRYGQQTLKRYARDIEIPYASLSTYRRVARAYPPENRRHLRFCIAQIFASMPEPQRSKVIQGTEGVTVATARNMARYYRKYLVPPDEQMWDLLRGVNSRLLRLRDLLRQGAAPPPIAMQSVSAFLELSSEVRQHLDMK